MTSSKKILTCTALFVAVCLILLTTSGCTAKYTEKTSFAMGSLLSAKIFADTPEQGDEIFELISTAVSRLDSEISPTNENSDIAVLNRTKNLTVNSGTKELLSDFILYCNLLDRNVDISIGAATALWGFSGDTPQIPDSDELAAAVASADIEKILIDTATNRITIPDDMMIDPGALGKGAACDEAYKATQYKYVPYIMSLGGTVIAYDAGPDNGKWTIGVRDPFDASGSYFATLSLGQKSEKNAFFVSTSGSYEKYFEEDGKLYHHILDPKTGMPVETELVSVTVVTSSGLSADALSTALFVKGLCDDSLVFIESLSAEAVFVFSDKTYYITPGLRDAFSLTADGFTETEYENEAENS